jgi:two-component system sporulation sensor kinase A
MRVTGKYDETRSQPVRKVCEPSTLYCLPTDVDLGWTDAEVYDSIKSMLFHFDEGVLTLDVSGHIRFANVAFARMSGFTVEECANLRLSDVLPALDEEAIWAALRAGEPIVTTESELRIKTGEMLPVRIAACAVRVRGGTYGALFVIRDQSDLKREMAQRKESEERFRWLVEHSPDVISYTDDSGRLIYVSPAVTRILGYHPEELLGETTRSLYHPDDLENLNQAMQDLLRDGHLSKFTRRMRHKDGHYVWLETDMACVYGTNGELLYCLGVARDVTDRKRMEKALLKSQKNLREAQRLANLGSWEIALDPLAIEWSEEMYRIHGVSPDTPLTLEFVHSRIHPEDLSRVIHAFTSAKPGAAFDVHHRIVLDSGEIRYLHTRGEVQLEDGRAVRIIGTSQDITDRKQTEATLQRSEELLRRSEKLSSVGLLAAGVAHEIRNPLTALKGFIRLMERSANEQQKQYLAIMHSELGRIETFVNELLGLAKPQDAQFEWADVQLLLDEVNTLLSTQAIMRGVRIHSEVAADVPRIRCVPNEVKQVFVNVVKNAIEAMPKGGDLRIRVETRGNYVAVVFADEGVGIPPEMLSRIGESFWSTKPDGTGLGMMVSNQIMKDHNGSIDIQSEPGKGTVVTVLFPIEQLGPRPESSQEESR